MLKECIVELVEEGKIFQGMGASHEQPLPGQEVTDTVPATATSNPQLNESIKLTSRLIAGKDTSKTAMFEAIVADTARTTLQKQLSAQPTGYGGGDSSGAGLSTAFVTPQERDQDKKQLDVFAAKDRWAQVAFGGKK